MSQKRSFLRRQLRPYAAWMIIWIIFLPILENYFYKSLLYQMILNRACYLYYSLANCNLFRKAISKIDYGLSWSSQVKFSSSWRCLRTGNGAHPADRSIDHDGRWTIASARCRTTAALSTSRDRDTGVRLQDPCRYRPHGFVRRFAVIGLLKRLTT